MIIVNVTQLCRRPGMPSEPTLRKIIAHNRDFPLIERGNGGRGYKINLEAAEAFIRQLRERRALDAVERHRLIRELGLEMLARDIPPADQHAAPPPPPQHDASQATRLE